MLKSASLTKSQLPSERKFGLLFTAVSLFLAGMGYHKGWPSAVVIGLLGLCGVFFVLATLFPDRLAPLNRAWFALGVILGKVISPIVLGVLFFLLVTPIALVTRAFGRDELRLKKRQTNSYWLDRASDRSLAESFKNQF